MHLSPQHLIISLWLAWLQHTGLHHAKCKSRDQAESPLCCSSETALDMQCRTCSSLRLPQFCALDLQYTGAVNASTRLECCRTVAPHSPVTCTHPSFASFGSVEGGVLARHVTTSYVNSICTSIVSITPHGLASPTTGLASYSCLLRASLEVLRKKEA